MRRRWVSRAAIALPALAILGCDALSPRVPEPPDEGSSEWVPPTQPAIAVQNLKNTFELGEFGDYARGFTEDFVFLPDPADVAGMETERPGEFVYLDWTKDVEVEVAEAIRTGQPLTLDLEFVEESLENDGRLRKYDYVLTLSGVTEEYRGQAWFRIRQEANLDWLIFQWQDVPETGFTTWGRLKGRSRS